MTSHVLFVDDEQANLFVWRVACADEFSVLCAPGGREALALMRRHEVAVILADQRMPGMTGIDLLEQVRHEHPDTLRILITAYSDLGAAVDAINRGQVRRYLRKPCPPAELKAELRDAVDLYELRRRARALECRLLLTERVYAAGLVAAGLGAELDRPARWIRERLEFARADLTAISSALKENVDIRVLKRRLLDLEGHLEGALDNVDRVLNIAHSVKLPTDEHRDEDVDVHDIIRAALRAVRGELRRGAEVELDLSPVPPVRGNSAKLAHVVLNLLASGVHAACARSDGKGLVTIRLRTEAHGIRLEVSDNGAPIPAMDLPHLFDPFHASPDPRGVGLGLAISRVIVEEMGGSLNVAHRSQGGALFRMTLPTSGALARCGLEHEQLLQESGTKAAVS